LRVSCVLCKAGDPRRETVLPSVQAHEVAGDGEEEAVSEQPDLLPAAKNIVECRLEDAPEKWEQLDDAINATEKRYAECDHTVPGYSKGARSRYGSRYCPDCGMLLEDS
jgi:hypothetical protein